jgi:hypothetical protein
MLTPMAATLLPASELRSTAAGVVCLRLRLHSWICLSCANVAAAVEFVRLSSDGNEAIEMLPPATTELLEGSGTPGLSPTVGSGSFPGQVASDGTLLMLSAAIAVVSQAAAAARIIESVMNCWWGFVDLSGCGAGRGNSGPFREILSECRPTTEMLMGLLASPRRFGSQL